jgi:ABC-type Mn2+/Zn2+ transport system permease subunit
MSMFEEPFVQRALAAALLLAPLCAFLGVFVTARRMAFFSDTISHAGLVGVALGFWLGLTNLTVPLVVVSLAIAAAIFWLRENTDLLTDTIMALLLSGSVAAGIIIMSLLRTAPRDIHSLLFGDILAVGWQEVVLAALVSLLVGVGGFSRFSEFGLITVQEELAQVSGVAVRRLNYLFVIGLTLAVALSIRLLGIILVTSLIVIPAAAARNISRNLRQHILLSIAIGFIGGLAGTMASYQLYLPTGPTIVMACIALFMATLVPRMRGAFKA